MPDVPELSAPVMPDVPLLELSAPVMPGMPASRVRTLDTTERPQPALLARRRRKIADRSIGHQSLIPEIDPERRRRFGLQGCEDFSRTAIVDRLADLNHEVVARSGMRGRASTAV